MNEEELTGGKYYHIYNCGINGENLFRNKENYEHFLGLLDKYILPVSDLLAWVLMPNHFHLLVRIKEDMVYKYTKPVNQDNTEWFHDHKWETMDRSAFGATENLMQPKPHLHFSHLFNAYCKYYNKLHARHGGLFERRFKRKHVNHERYFQRLVLYIHNNPVYHGFCTHALEYPWSSYLTCITIKPTKLKRDILMGWFDSEANFKIKHNEIIDFEMMDKWLGLED